MEGIEAETKMKRIKEKPDVEMTFIWKISLPV